jgi:pimeloyl-ACP methyl ester carboxylesterase
MGGAIALTLALDNPPWLRGLILTGTGARLRVSSTLLDRLQTDYSAAVEFILEHSFAPPNGPLSYAQKVLLNGTRKQLLRTPSEVTLADYEACNTFDVTNRITELTLPTLCIVGAQDEMTPPKYSQYLHQAIPRSQLAIIQNAGHMLPLESPDEYNTTITNFLITLGEKEVQGDSP